VAEAHRGEDLVVLLGTPTADASRLYAMTVTQGDPAWAGALAGVALGLPVYHVAEPDVKAEVAPATWEEHLALMEMVMDVGAIAQAVEEVRRG
jgi:betaine reductase